jgi:hypothetical protein
MSKNVSRCIALTFLLSVSFFGFFLIGVLSKSLTSQDFSWQKETIGTVYGLICIFGILAALFPSNCLRILDLERKKKYVDLEQNNVNSQNFNVQGHHRMCGNFSSHVFHIGNRTFCASCTGLLIGGLLSLAGTILYFFCNWYIAGVSFLFVFGVSGVALNMISILLFDFWVKYLVRVSLNFFFVFGTFLILVVVNEQVQNFGLNLLVVAFSVFWLLTRILLSQWRHERICDVCDVKNCSFRRVRAN